MESLCLRSLYVVWQYYICIVLQFYLLMSYCCVAVFIFLHPNYCLLCNPVLRRCIFHSQTNEPTYLLITTCITLSGITRSLAVSKNNAFHKIFNAVENVIPHFTHHFNSPLQSRNQHRPRRRSPTNQSCGITEYYTWRQTEASRVLMQFSGISPYCAP